MVKKKSRLALFIAILVFIILILALIIFTNLGTQSAQVAVPGVTEGNVFTYDVMGIVVSSSDSNATVPEQFLELNMTEWYKVTITKVSGPEVSISTVQRFKNGTEVSGTSTVNVDTGISSPVRGFWAIYAANLREQSRVRPNGPDRSTVNDTIPRDYGAGGTRETNLLTLITQYYDADDPTITYTEYGNTYFDKQTGMLVELRYISVYNDPKITLTLLWKIRSTNVWDIS